MPFANYFVWRVVLVAVVGAALLGLFIGFQNGLLEMKGFQYTFSELYNGNTDVGPGSGAEASYNFYSNCSNHDDSSQLCGSGNGLKSDVIVGLIVSGLGLGAAIGSLVATVLSNYLSRKGMLSIGGLMTIAGSAVFAASFYPWMVIISRCMQGIGVGFFYDVMPIYISEMTPKKTRGFFASFMGPAFLLGALVGLCANIGLAKFHIGWRIANIISVLSAIAFTIGMKWMPCTPRWLVTRQRDHEALYVLSRINANSRRDATVDTFLELEELRTISRNSISRNTLIKTLFKSKYRLVLAMVLFFFEAATGTFLYTYTANIFCQIGILPFISALIVGVINVAASIITALFMDKVGRKAILFICTLLDLILGAAIAAILHAYESPSELVAYIVLVLLCIYAFSYSFSWVIVPWVIVGEIFPLAIRGSAVAISNFSFWLFTFVVNQITPIILGSPLLQVHGYFYIITGANLLSILVVVFFLPETKGIGLEKIDVVFSQSWKERINLVRSIRSTTEDQSHSHIQESKHSSKV